ncbi:hypothetical protein [Streptosporangium sp. V21-05]|uniref:hypothetical protein n=1 Tax=Streptosporangium sp. V21-05 TaxID=3446115 RepID=UPI003F52E3C1
MRVRFIALCVFVSLLVAGCGGEGGSGAGGEGLGDGETSTGLTLPENAPPQVKRAYRAAVKAEDKRDKAEEKAIDVVEGVPVPTAAPPSDAPPSDPPPSEPPPPPDASVSQVPDGPDQPTDSGRPAEPPPSQPPPSQPPPAVVVPPVVPPEVVAAVHAWVAAQKEWIRQCTRTEVEMAEADNSGIGRIRQPVCGSKNPPPELVPWIKIMGIDVDSLIYG